MPISKSATQLLRCFGTTTYLQQPGPASTITGVGDACSCPIPGHTNCTITTGSPQHVIKGKRIAFDGDELSCGAKLVSSFKHFSTAE